MNPILEIGYDDKAVDTGLEQLVGKARRAKARVDAALNTASGGAGQYARAGYQVERHFGGGISKAEAASNRLNTSLERMTSHFSGGMGISAGVAGIGLLTAAFEKSMVMAQKFQTATISIAAQLTSVGTVRGADGKPLNTKDAFQYNMRQAEVIQKELLVRSTRNHLSFQEQLGAFESSLDPGARKGLNVDQILNISDKAAMVAKSLGLRGEEIANASRLLMGGGVNVARSSIGRALGVSNGDITARSGDGLSKFLLSKMKGFDAAEDEFGGSIQGIISTMESKIDVMASRVGKKFIEKMKPMLDPMLHAGERLDRKPGESLDDFTGRQKKADDAAYEQDKAVDALADAFTGLMKAVQSVVTSDGFTKFLHFLEEIAQYADKIVIAAVFFKIATAIGGASIKMAEFMAISKELGGIKSAGELASVLTNGAYGGGKDMTGRGGRVASGAVRQTGSQIASEIVGAGGVAGAGGAAILGRTRGVRGGAQSPGLLSRSEEKVKAIDARMAKLEAARMELEAEGAGIVVPEKGIGQTRNRKVMLNTIDRDGLLPILGDEDFTESKGQNTKDAKARKAIYTQELEQQRIREAKKNAIESEMAGLQSSKSSLTAPDMSSITALSREELKAKREEHATLTSQRKGFVSELEQNNKKLNGGVSKEGAQALTARNAAIRSALSEVETSIGNLPTKALPIIDRGAQKFSGYMEKLPGRMMGGMMMTGAGAAIDMGADYIKNPTGKATANVLGDALTAGGVGMAIGGPIGAVIAGTFAAALSPFYRSMTTAQDQQNRSEADLAHMHDDPRTSAGARLSDNNQKLAALNKELTQGKVGKEVANKFKIFGMNNIFGWDSPLGDTHTEMTDSGRSKTDIQADIDKVTKDSELTKAKNKYKVDSRPLDEKITALKEYSTQLGEVGYGDQIEKEQMRAKHEGSKANLLKEFWGGQMNIGGLSLQQQGEKHSADFYAMLSKTKGYEVTKDNKRATDQETTEAVAYTNSMTDKGQKEEYAKRKNLMNQSYQSDVQAYDLQTKAQSATADHNDQEAKFYNLMASTVKDSGRFGGLDSSRYTDYRSSQVGRYLDDNYDDTNNKLLEQRKNQDEQRNKSTDEAYYKQDRPIARYKLELQGEKLKLDKSNDTLKKKSITLKVEELALEAKKMNVQAHERVIQREALGTERESLDLEDDTAKFGESRRELETGRRRRDAPFKRKDLSRNVQSAKNEAADAKDAGIMSLAGAPQFKGAVDSIDYVQDAQFANQHGGPDYLNQYAKARWEKKQREWDAMQARVGAADDKVKEAGNAAGDFDKDQTDDDAKDNLDKRAFDIGKEKRGQTREGLADKLAMLNIADEEDPLKRQGLENSKKEAKNELKGMNLSEAERYVAIVENTLAQRRFTEQTARTMEAFKVQEIAARLQAKKTQEDISDLQSGKKAAIQVANTFKIGVDAKILQQAGIDPAGLKKHIQTGVEDYCKRNERKPK